MPQVNPAIPGITVRGCKGVLPGYDYLLPRRSCQIHVLLMREKPWIVTPAPLEVIPLLKLQVPCNMSMKELMVSLGCDNDDASKNIIYQIVETGNGGWSHGMRFAGDDTDRMKQSIADFGWTEDCTGLTGQKPVIFIWKTNTGE